MTTSLGDFIVLFKTSAYLSLVLSYPLYSYSFGLGLSADMSGGLGTCHHIRFWGVTNGIRARLHTSHMYKPSLSRVSRIGTETSVLIFERL